MFKNYLKVAFRNLVKQKVYSLINILGLAMGLAIFIFCAVFAGFDTNADKFHKNAERIYGVVQVLPSGNKGKEHTAFTPAPLVPALLNEFHEIEKATRIFPTGSMIIKKENKVFYENAICFVDPDFLSIFSFDMIIGDPATVLAEPYSIVLTKKAASKYFGEENPVGKVLTIDNKTSVTVTGVMENPVDNYSSIYFEFLVSMETVNNFTDVMNDWKINKQASFLLLPSEESHLKLAEKFPAFLNKYFESSHESLKSMYLLPLLDFRLKSSHITSMMNRSSYFQQYLLLVTGILMLLIVCINFMNLSTARYMSRVKEVGMRKVVGASRWQLMKQFLSESVIISLIALPVSLFLYKYMTTGLVRYIVNDQGELAIWNHPFLIKYLLGITILVGIISGGYPAFFLSSFKPVKIFKGNLKSGKKGSRLRKILVISQFSMAIILIVFTMSLKKQYDYIYNMNLGYQRDGIVTVKISDEARDNLKLMQQGLKRHKDILSVSAATALPGSWNTELQVFPEGVSKDAGWTMNVYGIDYNFFKTFGIQILKGRAYSREYNDIDNLIINETIAKQLQWENPIGKQLKIGEKKGTIIGVAKDFLFRTISADIGPTVLRLEPENLNYMIVRFSDSAKLKDIVDSIREQWNIFTSNLPFEYTTMDDHFYNKYKTGYLFITIFSFIDVIAIFVSCLGLLGLASFAVEKRTKEIGIRKALGASVAGIIRLIVREFMILIVLANIIAIPVAYYITDRVLEFGYSTNRIDIGIGIFLLTIFITLFTAAIAVTSQTIKAAKTNPVDSLKYE